MSMMKMMTMITVTYNNCDGTCNGCNDGDSGCDCSDGGAMIQLQKRSSFSIVF